MKPFNIKITQEQITDLENRLKSTRWVKESEGLAFTSSLSITTLKQIADYWQHQYDWRAQEKYLNSFSQFTTNINGTNLHFVYEKADTKSRKAILFLHGWASTYTKYLKVLEVFRKKNPKIDIVIPSMPGFGFSSEPMARQSAKDAALIMDKLMTEVLGYDEYYVHGGDFGAFVGEQMAIDFPHHLKGLHLSDIPYYHFYGYNENLTAEESTFIERINGWWMTDGGYAAIQGTKPKIISTALNDSPMGLAAWLLQLHNDFSDKEKDLLDKFDATDLLNNICIYWFTQSVYSSMRIYSEDRHEFGEPATNVASVPTSFCFFPHDISSVPPTAFVKRFFPNLVNISTPATGGHFAAIENPDALHDDIIKFINMMEK